MAAPETVHLFGIRHHGPGSARSLARALAELQPDAILIEGPPEGDELLPLANSPEMVPPVALLIYGAEDPSKALFYPFAPFSPEWQAIQHGLRAGVPVRFMDLPGASTLALAAEREKQLAEQLEKLSQEAAADGEADDGAEDDAMPEGGLPQPHGGSGELALVRMDPLTHLARAAGYSDGERWWESMVEHRLDSSQLFAAVAEAMTALRQELPAEETPFDRHREELREAHMRRTIRQAQKEGFQRIAVVCGAWHVPALATMPKASADNDLLKSLPKLKVQATWAPWTFGRLAMRSGYGAGIESPGWYDHLWGSDYERPEAALRVTTSWLTKAARLFRDASYDAPASNVIEAVRLAETLATLRGRPLPGLEEMRQSMVATICFGDELPLRLIEEKLLIGDRLGHVPAEAPAFPLQRDLEAIQKRLRLKPAADSKKLELDLRNENDLERSHLLHRLTILGVPWGTIQAVGSSKKGTFHEIWTVQWNPEFAVRLVEASIWGTTVLAVAESRVQRLLCEAQTLPQITEIIRVVLLANLPEAIGKAMDRLQAEAAVGADTVQLMDALPPLAKVLRYGDVRGTDTALISHVVDGLMARVFIGVGPSCFSLNDDAAEEMYPRIIQTHGVVALLENADYREGWLQALGRLAGQAGLHGLIAGRATRILLDEGAIAADEAGMRMGVALSRGNDPVVATAWIDGFLRGSGLLLLHDDQLWAILDEWVSGLKDDAFTAVVPLVRRTFASFPPPERQQMGQRLRGLARKVVARAAESRADFDVAAADAALLVVGSILGLKGVTA